MHEALPYVWNDVLRCTRRGQGPSCSSVKQLPTLKVNHVRFIENKVEDTRIDVSAGISEQQKRKISEISQDENVGHGKNAAAVTSVPELLVLDPFTRTKKSTLARVVRDQQKLEQIQQVYL